MSQENKIKVLVEIDTGCVHSVVSTNPNVIVIIADRDSDADEEFSVTPWEGEEITICERLCDHFKNPKEFLEVHEVEFEKPNIPTKYAKAIMMLAEKGIEAVYQNDSVYIKIDMNEFQISEFEVSCLEDEYDEKQNLNKLKEEDFRN